jgi:hypothetical protein
MKKFEVGVRPALRECPPNAEASKSKADFVSVHAFYIGDIFSCHSHGVLWYYQRIIRCQGLRQRVRWVQYAYP